MQQWKFFSDSMAALVAMLHEYSSFMQVSVGQWEEGMVRVWVGREALSEG